MVEPMSVITIIDSEAIAIIDGRRTKRSGGGSSTEPPDPQPESLVASRFPRKP